MTDPPELMIPGPGALHDDALEILGSPLLAHYGGDWPRIHADLVDAVGALLGCTGPYLLPGTGSAALDAALFNLFEPGQRVVVPDTGYFGARLVDMARAHRLDVVRVPVPVGDPVPLDPVADALSRGAHGLLCVHVETSTGVRHPVAELAALAGPDVAVVVDGIASAGGEALGVDDLGADLVVTASQKGLDGPPGIGILAPSARGRARIAARPDPCRSWYFDLRRWEEHRAHDPAEPHPVTMPTTALIALLTRVREALRTGLPERVRRRAALARRCREGLARLGHRPVPADGHEANLVVVAWAADPDGLADRVLRRAGIMVARGLGPTEGRAVRVGLVGRNATERMVDRLLLAAADPR
ncbi:aminotransferase class V-fold PLP-dependent enzyme [Micromonospora sp. B11E3]|uniref:pyridoxal-phosphate-dependent aminotransferase family protein n=1 Tax=Micromonospora sp. B11E3 TaxID=3153562 RepID=UPI00325D1713